jgi:DNA modification methylase
MSNSQQLQIESWPIECLIPYARNARTHSEAQVAQIAGSIAEFGFNNPVLADPDGGIIAGHGRVLAARLLKRDHVPVIVLSHLSENQKRAFMLADNKLALNAGWDLEMLRLELDALATENYDLVLTGFEERELDELIESERLALEEEAPALDDRPVSRVGDLWNLGEHRLLCGDATRSEDMARVLEGNACDMVFTDLPYNVDYTGKSSRKMKVANDDLGAEFGNFLEAACQSMLKVSHGPLYVCMSSSELHRLHAAFTAAGGHWSTYVVWAKNTFTLGRSDYQRMYEPILYGWPKGMKHYWCGDRNQGDVWFFDKPHRNDLHPTMKPVELIEKAIENSSRKNNLVLDPFAGSGSTLMACENLARKARLIEVDPLYVDVIIRRWQSYTGRVAVLEPEGRSFDEISAERDEQSGTEEREVAA